MVLSERYSAYSMGRLPSCIETKRVLSTKVHVVICHGVCI